jgi:DNA polymerase III gamma/tau subunit
MSDASGFTKLVPGFDFLQSLVKNAGAALPGIGQWVAPTLDPAELEKRIEELRTVQFWLEQNARMLGATIQALEVQRMTLSTLKTMNVQMDDLRESMQIRMPTAPAPSPAPAPKAAVEPEPEPEPAPEPAEAAASAAPAAPGVVDPMQWWGALTKQFTELATTAMKDTGADAARTMAGAMVKQTLDAAGQAAQAVGGATPSAAGTAAKKKAPARKSASKAAPRKSPAARR